MNFVENCSIRLFHRTSTTYKKIPDRLKGRSKSSQNWLIRQMKDDYVKKAKIENFRARSAFKLIEIDDQYHILKPGDVVVECGAAPGAWTQVCAQRINSLGKGDQPIGKLIAVDLLPMYPIEGAYILAPLDFTKLFSQAKITALAGVEADVILSDMAPSATGVKELDQDAILHLAFSVLSYAKTISKKGAKLLVKLWAGGGIKKFENELLLNYSQVKIVKPPSSRQDSSELFVLAHNFMKK